MLERSLMDMIDASQHLKHVDKAIEATCTASSNAVADEPVFPYLTLPFLIIACTE
jgi:hypothetical protein